MIKYIFLLIMLFGCSEINFLYSDYSANPLFKKTEIIVTGDDIELAKGYLISKIKNPEKNNIEFILLVKVNKKTNVQFIASDSTALKYEVNYKVRYELINKSLKCSVIEEKIETNDNFISKSAGYNFGSDSAEKDINLNNIKSNINVFIDNTSRKNVFDKCVDEN